MNHVIKISERNYYNDYFSIHLNDGERIWKGIKQIFRATSQERQAINRVVLNDMEITDPTSIANAFNNYLANIVGGAVASWLVRSSPERAVQVQALGRDIVLCFLARHSHSASLHPKWEPANLMLGGNLAMDWHPIQGGVEILLVASWY